jgi:hypothetical protein
MWNIHDLSAFENRKPRYTRAWLQKDKKKRKEARREKRKQVGFKQDTIKEESQSPVRSPTKKGEEEKEFSDYVSSEEDDKTIKGAA